VLSEYARWVNDEKLTESFQEKGVGSSFVMVEVLSGLVLVISAPW
jgi:hypothetical protein